MNIFFIMLGGATGASARYLLKSIMDKHPRNAFPYSTITVNFLGAFLLGMLVTFGISGNLYILLGEGFCGAFTTFSTFSYENAKYLKRKQYGFLFAFNSISLIWCILAYWIGGCMAHLFQYM